MLARIPHKSIRTKPVPAKRLNRDREKAVRDKIVIICLVAEPTPFAVEGPCRAGIRSSLCLQGWRWIDADTAAAEIVASALGIAGAKRPTWGEGQPEWTRPGALPIPRHYCARCGKKLPEGHRLWCSDVCAHAAKMDRQRRNWDEESYAAWQASKAAWKARQSERECEGCKRVFQPNRKQQRFCRYECSNITR